MPLRQTDAIVIGGHNLAEADRIVPFYTRRFGKVRLVAEGARRIRSRFGGSLELFTSGRLVFFEREGRTLHRINEFAVQESFASLREDLDLLGRGAYLVDLVASLTEEADRNEAAFHLLHQGLRHLACSEGSDLLLRGFEVRLMAALGYQPEVKACVRCRAPVATDGRPVLSAEAGGLVCPRCARGAPAGVPLGPEAVGFLRRALVTDLSRLSDPALSGAGRRELEEALRAYIHARLGRGLHSARFLERVRATLPT
jgi:DNA repair protein RecO (recombination protein O)